MSSSSSVKFFSGSFSRVLAEKMAKLYGTMLGELTLDRFADGEIQPNFTEPVRGSDVYLIQSTCSPSDNIMELLLMIDAARRASADYITVVTPYFGYARQDRKDKPRVSIGSKLLANLLTAAGANRIITMDLHAGQIQGFFDIPVDHLNPAVIFVPYIKSLELRDVVFAAPDMGSVARVRTFAEHFNAEIVICDKYRKRANEIFSMQLIGNVKDKNVVLVDDICDTAGTLTKSANLIKDKGAKTVRAVCTHAILSRNPFEKIQESALDELIMTDSIPLKENNCPKIKILSCAEIFARTIDKIHKHQSISSLFI